MAKDVQHNITALKGVNRFVDPRLIGDDEAYSTQDIYPYRPGILKQRPVGKRGYVVTQMPGTPGPVNIPPVPGDICATGTFIDLDPSIGFIFQSYTVSNVMHVGRFDSLISQLTNDYTVAAAAGYVANPIFSKVGKYLVVLPGSPSTNTRGVAWLQPGFTYDTTTDTWANLVFAGAGNTNVKPLGVCEYRGRPVYWNLDTGYEDCILFGDRYSPFTIGANALAADGTYIRVGSRGAGKIVGCVSVQLSSAATPAETGLLILREHGAYLLTGEPKETTETILPLGDLKIQDLNVRCSCVSFDSIVRTPHGIVWCGSEDVWAFQFGTLPYKIGTKIRPEIEAQSAYSSINIPDLRWKIHAAYFDGFYRLALYSTDQIGTVTSSKIAPNNQWWLDLRDGLPENAESARWFGPQVYRFPRQDANQSKYDVTKYTGTHAMLMDDRSGKVRRLYAPQIVDGSTTTTMAFAQLDGSTTDVRDEQGGSLLSNPGSFIQPKLVTKAYDAGDFGLQKIYTGLELALAASSGNVNVAVTPTMDDVERATTYRTLSSAVTLDQQVCYPDQDVRLLGNKVQLALQFNGKYMIDSSNNQIAVAVVGLQNFTVDLINGYYDDLNLLMTMIVGQLNYAASSAGTWSHNIPAANLSHYDKYTVTLSLAGGGTWAPIIVGSSVPATLWALIGFTNGSLPAAASQSGDSTVPYLDKQPFALHRATLRVNVIPRPLS